MVGVGFDGWCSGHGIQMEVSIDELWVLIGTTESNDKTPDTWEYNSRRQRHSQSPRALTGVSARGLKNEHSLTSSRTECEKCVKTPKNPSPASNRHTLSMNEF